MRAGQGTEGMVVCVWMCVPEEIEGPSAYPRSGELGPYFTNATKTSAHTQRPRPPMATQKYRLL